MICFVAATDDERNARVGEELAARREQLGITQIELAQALGVSARSISGVERGEHGIRRGRRQRWEDALHLQHGTISQAYRDGAELETVDDAPPAGPEPWHRIEWDLYTEAERDGLSEDDRRERVQIFRTHVMGWPLRRNWEPPDAEQRRRFA